MTKTLSLKLIYHDRSNFLKSLHKLRNAGGPKQQAFNKVAGIVGLVDFGMSELGKLTKNGEKRIKHCVKYDLPGSCRLVTVQKEKCIFFLFVGDHEDTDRWIQQNSGLEVLANKETGKITPILSNRSEFGTVLPLNLENQTSPLLESLDIPEFSELVPQKRLRKDLMAINQDTSDDEIEEIVELINDKTIHDLFFELFIDLREGKNEQANARLEKFRGESVELLEDSEVFDLAIESDINNENIVDFGKLNKQEIDLLLDPQRFEDWMLFLHPDQKEIVDAKYSKPAILRGVSGSGKTVIVIHRAKALANKYPDENIGIITLNRDLAKLIENLVNKLCVNGEKKRIKVQAYYDYFKEVIEHFGAVKYIDEMLRLTNEKNYHLLNILQNAKSTSESIINETCERSGETLEDTWNEFWNDEIEKSNFHSRTKRILLQDLESNFNVESYIRDEFDLIRSAFPLKYRDNKNELGYFEYKRRGREVGFSLGVREHILELLAKYEEYMLAGGMMDPLGLGQAVYPILPDLDKLPDRLQRRCLLVDEFQDFSTLELQFLKRVTNQNDDGLFLAGDLVQKVLVKDFDLPKAYLGKGDVKKQDIRKNYRNSRQILEAANELAQKHSKDVAKSDSEFEILDPEFAVRQTAMPIAVRCSNPVQEAWSQASIWLEGDEVDPCSVCLVSANLKIHPLREIQNACPNHLEAKMLDGDYMQRKDSVSVSTLSDVKGFEFGMIIIVGASEDSIPDLTYPKAEQWREALRLYVAMTRGRDQVIFTYREKPSEFLLTMTDFLKWSESVEGSCKVQLESEENKDIEHVSLKKVDQVISPLQKSKKVENKVNRAQFPLNQNWSAQEDKIISKSLIEGREISRISKKTGRTISEIQKRITYIFVSTERKDLSSISELARFAGYKKSDLYSEFVKLGIVSKKNTFWLMTEKGHSLSGHYIKLPNNIVFPVWPKTVLSQISVNADRSTPSLFQVVRSEFIADEYFEGYYLQNHIPKRTGSHYLNSEMILRLKSGNKNAVAHFLAQLTPLKECEFSVCAVPGHDPSLPLSGMRHLAKELGKLKGITDISDQLVRTKKIQKKSIGGIREVNEDLKSMKLSSANSFMGQDILIIDDVATTWTTMKAARRLIEAQGLPKNLVSLVLSRTLPQ
jgi:superfamily I DNA/RNA helicase